MKKEEDQTEEASNQLDCINDTEAKDQASAVSKLVDSSLQDDSDAEAKLQKDLVQQLSDISDKTKTTLSKVEESREENQKKETKMIQNFGIAQVQQAYAGQIQLCYDADLGLDDTRDNYINNHCKKIVASKTADILKGNTMTLLSDCMEDKNYCQFCCDYEVGVVQVFKKKECLAKCENALKNIIPPEITVKLNLVDKAQEASTRFRFKQNLKNKVRHHYRM